LPTILADNAGYDSAELVAQLRAAHTEGKLTMGLGKLSLLDTGRASSLLDKVSLLGMWRGNTPGAS